MLFVPVHVGVENTARAHCQHVLFVFFNMVTARFQILSRQMLNNSYSYIGGYLTHDRQTVCIPLSGVSGPL